VTAPWFFSQDCDKEKFKMKVGIVKERKHHEFRVALTPLQVSKIANDGHEIIVESGAGEKAGFTDDAYQAAGALIGDIESAYGQDLVLKVKCPLVSEYPYLRKDQTVFTFLHYDENIPSDRITAMVESGYTGIAYEWVQANDDYPILAPMSRLSGALFARRSMDLLLQHRGHIAGNYVEKVASATAMVIGLGRMGCIAARTLAQNGVRLVLVDKHIENIDSRIRAIYPAWNPKESVQAVIAFSEDNPIAAIEEIEEVLPKIDIFIGAAIRRPSLSKENLPFIITRKMVHSMKPGSIFCDATGCDKDLYETGVSSDDLYETYIDEGVVHYICDHIPSLAAHSASMLLAESSFPFVQQLLTGMPHAVANNPGLANAVMCYKGVLCHELSAKKKNLPWTPLKMLL
jgi:alanine dehydrogenase